MVLPRCDLGKALAGTMIMLMLGIGLRWLCRAVLWMFLLPGSKDMLNLLMLSVAELRVKIKLAMMG